MSPPRGSIGHTLIITLMIIFMSAPLAHAQGEQLGISRDGQSWTSSLSASLFDPSVRWVPGDSRSASVWVKNRSEDVARLSVDLVDLQGRSLLDTGAFRMLIMIDERAVALVDDRLVEVPATLPGEQIKITITVTFDSRAGNETQGRALSFNLIATLSQAPAESPSPPRPTPDEPSGIADTGATFGLGLLAVVGLAALISALIILRRGSGPTHAIHPNKQKGNQP